MTDGRHTENRFGYISAPYRPMYANFRMEMKNHMQMITWSLDQMAIFANSRWRTAAILKISLSPYLDRNYPISVKFGMPMQIYIPRMAIWQKSKFFKFKSADGRRIENRFFSISRRLIGQLT